MFSGIVAVDMVHCELERDILFIKIMNERCGVITV